MTIDIADVDGIILEGNQVDQWLAEAKREYEQPYNEVALLTQWDMMPDAVRIGLKIIDPTRYAAIERLVKEIRG